MAGKAVGQSYEMIMRDLRAGKFSPLYILMGDESYYIDKICDYIAENALQPEERDFNQDIVFGNDVTVNMVLDLAKGFPMMAARRVVIVKESQDLSHTELLEKYFEKPVKSTVLVFCHKNGSVDKRKKILSLAMANGVVFESNKKKDYELSPFIENYLKERGVAIEKKATMMMVENIGSDLHRLISELDKLQITLPANDKRITPDIVEKQIGVSKDFNGFELRNAIISKDVYKANEIMKYFDSNPKAGSPYMLLPLIFNFFENLMLAYYCPNPRNERELAAFLGLKSLWGVRDYITGMRNFTGRKTMQIIDKIRETDAKIKGLDSKNTPSGDIMKELIFFILH